MGEWRQDGVAHPSGPSTGVATSGAWSRYHQLGEIYLVAWTRNSYGEAGVSVEWSPSAARELGTGPHRQVVRTPPGSGITPAQVLEQWLADQGLDTTTSSRRES